MNQDISNEEKLEIFHEIKEDLEHLLEKIDDKIRKLKSSAMVESESDEITKNGS